ncbi:MAG: hypothetical protein ACO1O6_12110 [Bacteroidota bacterium]
MKITTSCALFLVLLSCTPNPPEKKGIISEKQEENDPYAHIEGTPAGNYYNPEYMHFKDISRYERRFIEETEDLRKHSEYNNFDFRDEFLIINKKDTFLFPGLPEMNDKFFLTEGKDDLRVILMIERVNFTSIDFKIWLDKGNVHHESRGRATLLSGFFLGEETEEYKGKTYPVSEFSYHSEDNACFAYIRIGKDDRGSYFATLSKTCNGKFPDIMAKDFPVLWEKR